MSENEVINETPKEKRKIGVGYILGCIFGVLFLLAALGAGIDVQILPAILLFIAAIMVLPPTWNEINKKMNVTITGGVKAIIVIVLIFAAGAMMDEPATENYDDVDIIENTPSQTENVEAEEITPTVAEPADEITVVSTSFSDFALYLDPTSTELQKETYFNQHYKGNYVTWTGTVSSVSESWGSYRVHVIHSPYTWISDVSVEMRDDQLDKLLQLKEGDTITYTAKMIRYGEILGMSAEDGVIVE